MGRELLGADSEGGKTGRGLLRDEIAAQTIEDDKNSTRHNQAFTSLSRTEKMS